MEKQLELDFTSECPEEARELGIRWAPRNATPEETKEWIETENKWWGDRALLFVAYASITQVVMLGLMMLSFWGINSLANG